MNPKIIATRIVPTLRVNVLIRTADSFVAARVVVVMNTPPMAAKPEMSL